MSEATQSTFGTEIIENIVETPVETPIETPIETPVETPVETIETPETPVTTPEQAAQVENEVVIGGNTETQVTQEFDLDKILETHRTQIVEKLALDDFDLEFAKFRKQGGDPYEYLRAKSFDWNKVPDEDIIKNDIAEKYKGMSEEDIQILQQAELKKYGLFPEASEEEERVGKVLLRAAATQIRNSRIEQQQKFKIPEVVKQEPVDYAAQYRSVVESNASTRQLLESKKVVFGTKDQFAFSIPDPTELIKLQYDQETQRKYLFDEQGEPDLKKSYAMGLMGIVGPDAFADYFINYGKRLGKKEFIDDGQNIQRPIVQTPQSPVSEADAMRQAKVGRVGG